MSAKMKQFTLCLNLYQKDAPSIYVFHGLVLFLPGLKSKKKKTVVKLCFSAVETRVVVFSTNELLSATNNVVRPALPKRNVIYHFGCHCDISRFVDLLSQRLQDKIKQHIFISIRSFSSSQNRLLPARRCKSSTQTNTQSFASESDIGLHLLENAVCTQQYDGSRLSTLAQGRSSFQLSAPLSTLAQDRSFLHIFFALLLIYLLSSKLPNPPSAEKKNS